MGGYNWGQTASVLQTIYFYCEKGFDGYGLSFAGKKRGQTIAAAHGKGEEQSGFKPYSKKHGMPIANLPPSKRFAAALAANAGTVDKPVAVRPQPVQRLYTPFSTLTAQGNPISPGLGK